MFTVIRNEATTPLALKLSGVIDETVNFAKAVGENGKAMDFYCGGITRINSIGIKLWQSYFQELRKSTTKIRFFDLAPPLVCTLNSISNFVEKEEVVSFCVPFFCGSCDKTTVRTYLSAESSGLKSECPSIPCTFCGSSAELDEVAEEYFSVLGN